MPAEQTNRKRRVVILGGGFAGAYCAQALQGSARKRDVEVVLIDRRNYFIFYPLLIEAGTGGLEPRHAVVSIRKFLKGARFLMAEATGVDTDQRIVHYRLTETDAESTIEYDALVVALGSVTKIPDIPGLKEYGFEMKSLADAVAMRDRAIRMLELANTVEDESERRSMLHFVVVGGNYTGVEVAGEFHHLLIRASKQYENVRPGEIKVTLVELTERILPTLDEDLSAYATAKLREHGVDVRLEETVTRIEPEEAELKSGDRLAARTVIWCAGIAPSPLIDKLPFPTDKRGYILTERDMRIKGFQNVWSFGDCGVNPDADGNPYPPTAQHAVRQAEHAAKDIVSVLEGRDTKPCDISPKGSLAAFGCRTGVARIMGVKFSGFFAWWLYRTVYLLKMPGIARKVRVALDWTIGLLFPRDYVQLNVHRRPEPTRAETTAGKSEPVGTPT